MLVPTVSTVGNDSREAFTLAPRGVPLSEATPSLSGPPTPVGSRDRERYRREVLRFPFSSSSTSPFLRDRELDRVRRRRETSEPSATSSLDPRPRLQFFGGVKGEAAKQRIVAAHVSVSHDEDFAIAQVLLETEAPAQVGPEDDR